MARTDKQIMKDLEKLPNWGGDCDCGDCDETVKLTHHGEWDEDFEYCLTCGGVV